MMKPSSDNVTYYTSMKNYKKIRQNVIGMYEAVGIKGKGLRRYDLDIVDKLTRIFIEDVVETIYRDILTVNLIGFDEKVYKYRIDRGDVQAQNLLVLTMISERLEKGDKDTPWQDLMLSSSERFVISQDEKGYTQLYCKIPDHVGKYLMENGYSPLIYDMITNKSIVRMSGNSVEVLKEFINKEPTIYKKKNTLGNLLVDENYDIDSPYFPFLYIQDKVNKGLSRTMLTNFDKGTNFRLTKTARAEQVEIFDYLFYVYNGVGENTALAICKDEQAKYNVPRSFEDLVDYGDYSLTGLGYMLITLIEMKIKGEF